MERYDPEDSDYENLAFDEYENGEEEKRAEDLDGEEDEDELE